MKLLIKSANDIQIKVRMNSTDDLWLIQPAVNGPVN